MQQWHVHICITKIRVYFIKYTCHDIIRYKKDKKEDYCYDEIMEL